MAKRTRSREQAQPPNITGWLHRTLHLYGVVHQVEVPPGPGAEAELDRACQEVERRAKHEHVGAKVVNANPDGPPPRISDDDLARRWLAVRRSTFAWKREAVAKQVEDDLRKAGIPLGADRITKRVRRYLQARGEWT